MKININKTPYADTSIIDAVEATQNSGKSVCDFDNSTAASDSNVEDWEKIEYTMEVWMPDGESVTCIWRPTKELYNDAVVRCDTRNICDWDTIDEVR